MSKSIVFLLILISVFLSYSCQEDLINSSSEATNSNNSSSYPSVDQRLWPYFAEFEQEASSRGFKVSLSNSGIRGLIQEIAEQGIAGQCSYGNRQSSREIIIDTEFWNKSSRLYKEYIVFHELGHCYLNRDHKDACFSNRTVVSIMRSGHGTCRDNYTNLTRNYYVDELFGLISD